MNVFLLGAGFNSDATREAGPLYGNPCGYPLVGDVLKLCFGLDSAPAGKSVEELFSEAIQARDYKPMQTLVDCLMEADFWIAQKLASSRFP